ncbi:FecR domain-containing protein [Pontibacter sp. BT731]|uniref:FecR domain-containing protein n=1 Tax=Pontibacter coccineus TaxID=3063328 RepID=UPI0026E1C48E|nr:FecR domain-containing protein [Pontibacter sp. BT731]MDO6388819.1 FecR domain-containing protein [Pontibacter sp. BT731]
MNNATATAAELAADHDFIQWVKYPTRESTMYWSQFAEQYPEKAQEMAEARRLVLLLSQEQAEDHSSDEDADLVWEQLQEAIQQDREHGRDDGPVFSLWGYTRRTWLSAAAVIILLLATSALLFTRQSAEPVTYATAYGEKRIIQLSDKSVIVLNANSSITIPEKWEKDEPRTVQLRGEAFFSVTQQPNRQQFIVKTSKGTEINVLGTEFNVYDRGQEDRVVLANGKVRLSATQNGKTRQLEMQPGDLVTVSAAGDLRHRRVDPDLYTAWQHNKVYFDDYTLREVGVLIEQQYGYKVEFSGKELSGQRITAFLEVKNPEDILHTLAETFELKITQQENTIYISSL